MNETTIEATGLRCPLPLLKLKQWLINAGPGDQLQLIIDDHQSIVDVPKWLSQTPHTVMDIEQQPQATILRVRKSND